MNRARRLCLKLAVVLTAFTAFLLPLKFGGITGLVEAPGFFPHELFDWLIVSSWPTEIFAVVCGAALVLALCGGAARLPEARETRLMLWLWASCCRSRSSPDSSTPRCATTRSPS